MGLELVDVFDAYDMAKEAHKNQKRRDGLKYITHPVAVTQIAREYSSDNNVIIASLLHDVVEDTDVTLDQIREKFGDLVSYIVDAVTKVGDQRDTFSKMEKYSQQDSRCMLVKLADRIHNTGDILDGDESYDNIRSKYARSNSWYIQLGKERGLVNMAFRLHRISERKLGEVYV